MRRFLIDTDTASDDAVALIMALREPDIRVEAITVVAGNLPLPLAVKNALLSVEVANTYRPPVFAGMATIYSRPNSSTAAMAWATWACRNPRWRPSASMPWMP